MMNAKRRTVLAAILLCPLLVAGAVLAAPAATSIDRWVVGGGGGYLEAGTTTLEGTIGQPVVGKVLYEDHDLDSGFWFGMWVAEHGIYLPLVVRDAR